MRSSPRGPSVPRPPSPDGTARRRAVAPSAATIRVAVAVLVVAVSLAGIVGTVPGAAVAEPTPTTSSPSGDPADPMAVDAGATVRQSTPIDVTGPVLESGAIIMRGQAVAVDGSVVVRNVTGVPVSAADGDARVFAVRRVRDGEFDGVVDQFRVDGTGRYVLETDRFDAGLYALTYRGMPVGVDGGVASVTTDPIRAAFVLTEDPGITDTALERPAGRGVAVPADERLQVAGSTALPPGTELVVTVRSTGETQPRYVATERSVVGADGEFAAAVGLPTRPQSSDTARVTVAVAGNGLAPTGGTLARQAVQFVTSTGTTSLPPPLSLSPPSTADGTGSPPASGSPSPGTVTDRDGWGLPDPLGGVGPVAVLVPLGTLVALAALAIRRR